MKVRKDEIPPDSLVHKYMPADYADAYSCPVRTALRPDDVMVAFWTDSPGWVGALFAVRDFAARMVGLEGSGGDLAALEKCIRRGGTYRFASVPAKNDRETLLILNDKHLEAAMSVYIADGKAYAITVVKFHNRLGRVYFALIKPFHCLVVKGLLKSAVNK